MSKYRPNKQGICMDWELGEVYKLNDKTIVCVYDSYCNAEVVGCIILNGERQGERIKLPKITILQSKCLNLSKL